MMYREATTRDTEKIALLHAQSWQQHYRGILRDDFLNNDVSEDRLATWESRLKHLKSNQYILLAEENDKLCGFACAFSNEDPVWGTLLDNLHVSAHLKGQGIGTTLLKSAAQWAYKQNPAAHFHLWVYEKNSGARRFYESLGAINYEMVLTENPGGGFANACRYVWTDVKKLTH